VYIWFCESSCFYLLKQKAIIIREILFLHSLGNDFGSIDWKLSFILQLSMKKNENNERLTYDLLLQLLDFLFFPELIFHKLNELMFRTVSSLRFDIMD